MRLRWHKFRAKMSGLRHVLRNVPWRAGDDESDYRRSFVVKLLYRMGKGDYWRTREMELSCGCFGYEGYVSSFLVDCPEHGMDTWSFAEE